MNNIVKVNSRLLDLAIKYDNGIEPTKEDIYKLKLGLFDDNIEADAHLLYDWIANKYNIKLDNNDMPMHIYIKACISDFRRYLVNKGIV